MEPSAGLDVAAVAPATVSACLTGSLTGLFDAVEESEDVGELGLVLELPPSEFAPLVSIIGGASVGEADSLLFVSVEVGELVSLELAFSGVLVESPAGEAVAESVCGGDSGGRVSAALASGVVTLLFVLVCDESAGGVSAAPVWFPVSGVAGGWLVSEVLISEDVPGDWLSGLGVSAGDAAGTVFSGAVEPNWPERRRKSE